MQEIFYTKKTRRIFDIFPVSGYHSVMDSHTPNSYLSDYERGRLDERKEIEEKIRANGYDWANTDKKFSPLQHLLNWLADRS